MERKIIRELIMTMKPVNNEKAKIFMLREMILGVSCALRPGLYLFTLNGYPRTVSYDNASRITALTDATSQTFGYDDLDRLTGYTAPSASQSFGYDAVGNRTQLNDGGSIDTYSYAPTSNRLTAISGAHAKSYGYAANGNITADGANTYSYDPRNRLVSANASNYVLNGLGQRIEKQDSTAPAHGPGDADGDDAYSTADGSAILNQILQTASAAGNPDCNQDGQVNVQDLVCLNNQIASGAVPVSGGKVLFAYDERGQVVGEYNGSGNAIEETVYLGSQPVAVLKQGNVYYIHTDQLNTPRVISDSTDKVVWRWDSDPFGTTAANDDPDLDGVKFAYDLRFPGQVYDGETGLHYNYFRDYDPGTGRYLESDPIGLVGGINSYIYVRSNPIYWVDILGLCPGDKQKCVRNFLQVYYGNFVADTLVPEFSAISFVTNFANFVKGSIISAVAKGALVGLPALASKIATKTGNNLAIYPGMGSASANALETGAFWKVTSATLGESIAVGLAGISGFSTAADAYARWECRNVE